MESTVQGAGGGVQRREPWSVWGGRGLSSPWIEEGAVVCVVRKEHMVQRRTVWLRNPDTAVHQEREPRRLLTSCCA